MKYQIDGLSKFWEEDNWERGTISDTEQSSYIEVKFEAETIKGVISKVSEFLSVGLDGIELNSLDEDGRIDFAGLENRSGNKPSSSELKKWKLGKFKLYYVVYTGVVTSVVVVKIPQDLY